MTPYREKDFIITALSPNGLVSFKAGGLSKPTSKFSGIVTLYALVDAELEEKKTGLLITNAVAISKNYKIISDYNKLSALNFIGEACLRILHDQDDVSQVFLFVKTAILALEQDYDPFSLSFIVIAKLLKAVGYGLNVDSCVRCGAKKDIVAISYLDGGFVCRKDFDRQTCHPLSVEALNIIRYAFLVPIDKMLTLKFDNQELITLFDGLTDFYQDVTNTQLKSYTIFRQSLKS